MLPIQHEQAGIEFPVRLVPRLDASPAKDSIEHAQRLRRKLRRLSGSIHLVRPCLQDQHIETTLPQLIGRPTTRGAGAHDDCVPHWSALLNFDRHD